MNDLPHLRLEGTTKSLPYTSTGGGGGGSFEMPPRNPSSHAAKLQRELKTARDEARKYRDDNARSAPDMQQQPEGVVLTFESDPSFELKLESLENRPAGIKLVSVRKAGEAGAVTQGKVFVPEGKLSHFFKLLEDYTTKASLTIESEGKNRANLEGLSDSNVGIKIQIRENADGTVRATIKCPVSELDRILTTVEGYSSVVKIARKNEPLIHSIASVRLTMVEEFWQDSTPFPTHDIAIWWEVWLRGLRVEAANRYDRFKHLALSHGLRVSERFITFPENVVCLAYGTGRQLSQSIDLLTMLSELRRAKELATPYVTLTSREQRAFADDLLGNVIPPPSDAPAVCILDGGVNRGHILISPGLAEADVQAVDDEWGTADHDKDQHGTGMAGIALYGCLTQAFTISKSIQLRHRLESVKLLPPSPKRNNPDVYGAVTQQAISKAMIREPTRNRAICMAVTADDTDKGLPTSWSAAVDEICAGVLDETPKLMFVSAGNIRSELFSKDYCYHDWNCQHAGIEDPGQAWNAITVGAYTEKVTIQDPEFSGWEPIAKTGDLCPTSRTSLAWPDEHHAGWPIKPDIVLEGGNYAHKGGDRSNIDDLSLLTTILHPTGRLLQTTRDTSPATAAAARMAAIIWSQYPNLLPETIRALMVHSARWTPAMKSRFPGDAKSLVGECLRCYGYGVPDLNRAMHSLKNRATLIYEGALHPFEDSNKNQQMHLHALPWPKEALRALPDDTPVTMRLTLSYFVEPSPGGVGWGTHHRYQSHGLRFDVIRPLGESVERFLQRISRAQWDNPKDSKSRPESVEDNRNWVVGSQGRTHGSLHSDWWKGTGAELAACDHIAIYPVTGWWRERRHLGRLSRAARYSLVASIETPKTDVDLYTPITVSGKVMTEVLNSW